MTLLSPLPLLWLVAAGAPVCFAAAAAQTPPSDNSMLVYIGTYTGAKSQGIYVARFDPATGRLSPPELAAKVASPSFLALHPNRRFLYAVSETSSFGGQPGGALSAFAIAADTGKLTLLNQQGSGGSGPCHLALDHAGQCLLTANYGSGSVALLRVQTNGYLTPASSVVQHHGSSVNPQRQEGPHAHFIMTDPADRFALTCDLGLDKVLVYRLDAAQSTLVPNDPPSAPVKPGAGPRHLAFHPNGRLLFVISEMASSLTAFAYDPQRGALQELQTVSTLPESFAGQSSCAEVQVHPSGKFVYGSNRGHDSIAVFSVAPDGGRLALVQHQSALGKTPRHFALVPGGNWLLAENMESDNVVVFRVDARTGRLTPAGQEVKVGSPVCAEFLRRQ